MSDPVKVLFPVDPDEEGNPGVSSEELWCLTGEGSSYAIDNIPFYVRDLSIGDIKEAKEECKRRARFQGGTSGNAINGISDNNPNRQAYMDAAEDEFGSPPQQDYLPGDFSLDPHASGGNGLGGGCGYQERNLAIDRF